MAFWKVTRPSLWLVTGQNAVCYDQVYDLFLVRTLSYDQVYDLLLVRTLCYDQVYDLLLFRMPYVTIQFSDQKQIINLVEYNMNTAVN
jgi:hypothetical protein